MELGAFIAQAARRRPERADKWRRSALAAGPTYRVEGQGGTMAKPTAKDARLMLQLATWYTESQVGEAMNWARSDAFTGDYGKFRDKFPSGSDERNLVNRILGYYETVGTLWKNGLINEALLFDWLWVPGSWDLVKAIALGMRDEFDDEGLWENFEAMAERERKVAAKTARTQSAKKGSTKSTSAARRPRVVKT